MTKLSKNQLIGVILLVVLALIHIQIPFINGRNIASIIILALAIYELIR